MCFGARLQDSFDRRRGRPPRRSKQKITAPTTPVRSIVFESTSGEVRVQPEFGRRCRTRGLEAQLPRIQNPIRAAFSACIEPWLSRRVEATERARREAGHQRLIPLTEAGVRHEKKKNHARPRIDRSNRRRREGWITTASTHDIMWHAKCRWRGRAYSVLQST